MTRPSTYISRYNVPISGHEELFTTPHRFTFNGQERTDEIAGTGNHTTALYWEFDTRLGRRWNVDPMSEAAPDWSPYRVLFCNPNYWTDPNGLFETRKEAKAFKKEHGLKGTITKDEEGDFVINGNDGNLYSFGTVTMKPVEVVAIKNVPQINKIDSFDGVPRQDFSGFRGILKHFWTGGNIGNYHYNMDGKAIGIAPITGTPPSIGIGKIKNISEISTGLQALFKDGVRGNSIINIRNILLNNGFTQRLSNNKSGYLFINKAGEEVRIMFRNGGWDVRVMNKFGNYLDDIGRVKNPNFTHEINVFSK